MGFKLAGKEWGQQAGSKLENLVGAKGWSPEQCRRWGQWEAQGELGGWEAVVRECEFCSSGASPGDETT